MNFVPFIFSGLIWRGTSSKTNSSRFLGAHKAPRTARTVRRVTHDLRGSRTDKEEFRENGDEDNTLVVPNRSFSFEEW